MVLKLEKDKQVYSFDVSDINKGEKLYYKFQINTSTLPEGKYSLTLYDDDENIVAEDVLYIGNFVEKSLQYTKGENVYINSPFSANIEPEKSAEISNTIVTIYPSEEYDGMASVKVNASAVYQSGFESGNVAGLEQGKILGKEEQKSLLTSITITKNGTYIREDGYNEVIVTSEDKPVVPNGIKFNGGYATFNGILPSDVWTKNDWSNFYDCDGLFKELRGITDFNIDDFSTIGLIPYLSTIDMFNYCWNLEKIPQLDTSNVVLMNRMFQDCHRITTIPELNTSNVVNMSSMFKSCEKLTTIPELDTSNVVNMSYMFTSCNNLTTIPQLDTSKVTDMTSMFATCPKLKNIELNVSNATNLSSMFRNANGIENIKIYNIDNVTTMSDMFYGAVYYIKEITFTGNPSNLTNVSGMFGGNSTPDGFTLYYDNRYDYSKIIGVLPNKCTAIPITIE